MKSKEDIEEALDKEYLDRDSTKPMDEMDWAHNQGWIEALEFVLDAKEPINISHLLKGANNDTIARANKRLAKELGFGRKDNVIDSENDSIRDGWLYAPQKRTA